MALGCLVRRGSTVGHEQNGCSELRHRHGPQSVFHRPELKSNAGPHGKSKVRGGAEVVDRVETGTNTWGRKGSYGHVICVTPREPITENFPFVIERSKSFGLHLVYVLIQSIKCAFLVK